MGLVQESVKERWGDPWLEDLPATDVRPDHGILVCGLFGESSGSEGHDSEIFHLIFGYEIDTDS